MVAALLLISQSAETIQLGTVDVGGRQIAVTVPKARGPFTPDTPHTVVDGWSYETKPDGTPGVRYKSDGGWGEVADAYAAASARAASAPEYRVRVFVLENTFLLEEGTDGVWRERPGSMSPAQKEEVYASLARLKALAEVAGDGGVRLTFEVTVDPDIVFRTTKQGAPEFRPQDVVALSPSQRPVPQGTLGPTFVFDEIAPRFNNDAFEAEDGKYRGPYSSVFVIHAMGTWDAATYLVDRTPLTSFSLSSVGKRDLGIQLFYAWQQHLDVAAAASRRKASWTTPLLVGEDLPTVPHVFDTPLSANALTIGNRMQNPGFADTVFPNQDRAVRAMRITPMIEPHQNEQPTEAMKWLLDLKSTPRDESVTRLREILKGNELDLRLNALATLGRIKCPELIPDVAPMTSSAFPGEAYMAIRALVFQDEDRAWSQIANCAVRGPFGANYMFAAQALAAKKEDITLEVLGMSLLSQSWHARLAAVGTINAMDTEQAGVVASATLGGAEPDPVVRFAIVSKPRPQSSLFARRLLFAAVNDESEWVRTASYLALIDSETEEIRKDALRGVRDPSVGVRLAILKAMEERKKDYYRPALQIAVIDADPVVRAAALRAFATQPGDVTIAEVQNTVSDPSPLVKRALQDLAKAKGLQIPPQP